MVYSSKKETVIDKSGFSLVFPFVPQKTLFLPKIFFIQLSIEECDYKCNYLALFLVIFQIMYSIVTLYNIGITSNYKEINLSKCPVFLLLMIFLGGG